MDAGCSFIVAVKSAATYNLITATLRRWNCTFTSVQSGAQILDQDAGAPVFLISDGLFPDMSADELVQQFTTDPTTLRYVLWIPALTSSEDCFSLDAMEDCLMQPFNCQELRARIRSGIRQLNAWRQIAGLRLRLEDAERSARSSSALSDQITSESIEIAAQLQSEIFHNAALEAEHIRLAKSDTVMQAAATLRHEINNPLFVISGSAETIAHRLSCRTGAAFDIRDFQPAVRRIMEASERIRQVVQAFSAATTPTSVDYLPGIPMIEISRQIRKAG